MVWYQYDVNKWENKLSKLRQFQKEMKDQTLETDLYGHLLVMWLCQLNFLHLFSQLYNGDKSTTSPTGML